LADQRERLPTDSAAGHEDGDAGLGGQLRRDAYSVRHDRQLSASLQMTRDLECGGARVQRDAVAVFHEARRLRSDERFLCRMEAGPNLESQLRSAPADSDGAPMGAEDTPFPLEYGEVLSNRDFCNRQSLAQVDDRGACIF